MSTITESKSSNQNSTISLHTEKQAYTTYTNFNFNSFCQFNDVFYGVNENGIFAIGGESDNNAQINAEFAGGIEDFGTTKLKMIGRCYIGYRSSGNLMVSLSSHDDGVWYDYILTDEGKDFDDGMYTRSIVPGRGFRSRYFDWKVCNINGATFDIDAFELNEIQISRKIGGSDG